MAIRNEIRSARDDSLWGEWMALEWKKRMSVEQMAGDQTVRPVFRRRAIQILMTPDFSSLPFPAYLATDQNNFIAQGTNFMRWLSGEDLKYAAGLIPGYIEQAKRIIQETEKTDTAQQTAKIALENYNDMILQLLPKVPMETAERLVDSYSLVDPRAFFDYKSGAEINSGYNPLERLLQSDVTERLKLRALGRMHQIVLEERLGDSKPRTEWEGAMEGLREILGNMVNYRFPVSRKLVEDEIEFMMEVVPEGEMVLDSELTYQAFQYLTDEESRKKFVRRQIFGVENKYFGFSIDSDYERMDAAKLMRELPEEADIVERLADLIEDYDRSARESGVNQRKYTEEKLDIFRRMKRKDN